MIRVLIYGAGSIGNHLAYACKCKGWDVTIYDIDADALTRTQKSIYPERYGAWDDSITLVSSNESVRTDYDVVIVGTPPDTHLSIAKSVLSKIKPKVLLIEKPLCTPDIASIKDFEKLVSSSSSKVLTGYNHIHTKNTKEAETIIKSGLIGRPLSITVRWVEHWGGIFSAHPWLNGPAASYLGYSGRGGGACGEHSHGINIWQHFCRILGSGKIKEVSCTMDMVKESKTDYDRNCMINVVSTTGLVGSITQDVITDPPLKMVRVQGDLGFLEWYASYNGGKHDAVIWGSGKEQNEMLIPRRRPDDFVGEIDEIEAVLVGKSTGEAISFNAGYDTMLVVAAAYRSHQNRKACFVEY
jgi:predicted dehydrogenase